MLCLGRAWSRWVVSSLDASPDIQEGVNTTQQVEVFSRQTLAGLPPAPICWMWNRLAARATEDADVDVLLLLGMSGFMEVTARVGAYLPSSFIAFAALLFPF